MFFTVLNAFVTLAPIIFVDCVGLSTLIWPTQLYVTIIETLTLSILIIILEIIEMINIKKLIAEDDRRYDQVNPDSMADGEGDKLQDVELRKMLDKLRAEKFTKKSP